MSYGILLIYLSASILISCSDKHDSDTYKGRSYKLSPESSFQEMGFGWTISANENYLVATSYDKETYLFKKADGIWKEDHTDLNKGYTLSTDISEKHIAVSYLSSAAKRIIKVLKNVDGSWQKDVILKNTGSVFEEFNGTISVSDKHLIVGFSPTCPDVLDNSGILIYTKQDKCWAVTARIESDSCKDYDLKPLVITDNFAFLSSENSSLSDSVNVLFFNNSKWQHKCDLGPFRYVDLIDANERFLAIVSLEGDSIKIKPEIFIYELFNDSISKNPIIIKDFNEELSDLRLYNDKLLIAEMAVPYFSFKWGSISNVSLYQINECGFSKIAQYPSGSKNIRRLLHKGDWNRDGFGFSVGLNSEFVFIGSPKDDIFSHYQGSVTAIRY